MKMLTTQLSGLFQRIASSEEENIDDTARLLAQAAAGEGKIYFASFEEMESISINAKYAAEPFPRMEQWKPDITLTSADRVWILTRSSTNEEALALAKKLNENFIPFSALASEPAEEGNMLFDLSYTYISLKITKGLLPADDGSRLVQPHALAGLFIYEAVKLQLDEMIKGEE
ncbi:MULTISPECIES: DUF2529 family protein [unclassified Psychrobacillus]|uniref:DUF2529 family protein n=1 Tax=unclassified Psychrobacillus TaxID=2636677 RepID=UPI00119F9EA2|nr:DUF2529 family protein [Bacillus sp. N3536]